MEDHRKNSGEREGCSGGNKGQREKEGREMGNGGMGNGKQEEGKLGTKRGGAKRGNQRGKRGSKKGEQRGGNFEGGTKEKYHSLQNRYTHEIIILELFRGLHYSLRGVSEFI